MNDDVPNPAADHTPPVTPPSPVARTEGAPKLSIVAPWQRDVLRLRECRELAGISDSEVLTPAFSKLLVFVCDAQRENVARIEELERKVMMLRFGGTA